ncbi:hypothetical protein BHM03_00014848 [Ensete ventricosum]|nr:hypothetical protein BHM03_00014848 [Ensete ventricosum]
MCSSSNGKSSTCCSVLPRSTSPRLPRPPLPRPPAPPPTHHPETPPSGRTQLRRQPRATRPDPRRPAQRGGQRRRQRGSGRCRGRCGRTRLATGQSRGVEEEDGEEGERVGGEDLVVVEAEVGAEPDDEAASSGRRRELEILEGVESLKEGLEGAGD